MKTHLGDPSRGGEDGTATLEAGETDLVNGWAVDRTREGTRF